MNHIFESSDTFEASTFRDLFYEDVNCAGKTFKNVTFEHCTFMTCDFEGCSFVECSFINCNLSAVSVKKTRFYQVNFIKSKVIGIDWTDKYNFKITGLHFDHCVVNYSVFNGIILKDFVLTNSIAHEVDFIETDMNNADCKGTDFDRSNFLRTKLKNADFCQAINYHIDPNTNSLKGIKVSMPEALSFLDLLGISFNDEFKTE